MADSSRDRFSANDLLYPEIMVKEAIVYLLQKRGCRRINLNLMQKQALVDLYNKVVLPFPQRQYRKNRIGSKLRRLQKKVNLRWKKDIVDEKDEWKEKMLGKNSRKSSGVNYPRFSHSSSTAEDRLKPPPSAINNDRKVIKLGSSNDARHSHKHSSDSYDSRQSSKRSVESHDVRQSHKHSGVSHDGRHERKITLSTSSSRDHSDHRYESKRHSTDSGREKSSKHARISYSEKDDHHERGYDSRHSDRERGTKRKDEFHRHDGGKSKNRRTITWP